MSLLFTQIIKQYADLFVKVVNSRQRVTFVRTEHRFIERDEIVLYNSDVSEILSQQSFQAIIWLDRRLC